MEKISANHSSSSSNEPLELDNQLCFALHAASRLVIRRYWRKLHQLGITHTQYLALLVLWAWDRDDMPAPTTTALGERLDLDSGTLTPLLQRLERRRLITRRQSEQDRRVRFIRLTAEGRALNLVARGVSSSLIEDGSVSQTEVRRLRDQLNRLRALLSQEREPAVSTRTAQPPAPRPGHKPLRRVDTQRG